jgi:predicted sugar kinase
MSERLRKFFTEEELKFIEELAKQKGLKPTDVVYLLAREMIQTYNLKFVSGQQVLALLDLLSIKLPQWFALQLNMLGQSSLQVKTLSKQLASLDQPSLVDKIIELLKTPEVSKIFSSFSPFLSMFIPNERQDNGNEENKSNSNEGDWL